MSRPSPEDIHPPRVGLQLHREVEEGPLQAAALCLLVGLQSSAPNGVLALALARRPRPLQCVRFPRLSQVASRAYVSEVGVRAEQREQQRVRCLALDQLCHAADQAEEAERNSEDGQDLIVPPSLLQFAQLQIRGLGL